MSSRQIIRVVDLETTGSAPPAHGVCEIGWQDVALGEDGRWALEGEGGSILVNPGRPIPPITQAVHHILEEQVADAPWWHDIARQVLDPWPRRLALAAHRADFEQIGRASWRESVCPYVEISVVAVSFKKKKKNTQRMNLSNT